MKYASATLFAFVVFVSGSLAACASGETNEISGSGVGGSPSGGGNGGDGGGGTTTSATTTTTTTTTTGGGDGGGGGGAMCASPCASDSECQNSCPVPGMGTYCCDTATGICYQTTQNVCPTPNPTGGGAGPMY